MRLSLAFLTLLAAPAVTAAAQEPQFSAPKALPGDHAAAPSAGNETGLAIGAGPGISLAVWTDGRSTLAGSGGTVQGDQDVLAVRLDAQGRTLDASPFVISDDYGWQLRPQVAWNGQNWLVAWEAQVETTYFYESRIRAVRVSPAGVVLDAVPMDAGQGDEFTLCANGGTWLIVTQGYQAGANGLYGHRIAADGSVLDPGGVLLVPPDYYLLFGVRVQSTSGEYFLAWDDLNSGFLALRLDGALNRIGARLSGLPSSTFVSDGVGYLFSWFTAGPRLVVSPASKEGILLDPAGRDVGSAAGWDETALGWDGSLWWVGWTRAPDGFRLARVTAQGVVLDPDGFSLHGGADDPRTPRLAGRAGGGVQAAWQIWHGDSITGYDLQGSVVGPGGNLGPEQFLAASAPAQLRPDFAAGPDGCALAFQSLESGIAHVKVDLLDRFGNARLASPIEVASRPTGYASHPAIAWNGNLYLVTWAEQSGIYARRMLPDGSLLDALPIFVMPGSGPDVDAIGGIFLVAGVYAPSHPHFRYPFGARVDGNTGAVLDAAPIQLGNSFASQCRVVAAGNRWAVAYQRNFSHDDAIAGADLTFVDAQGVATAALVVGTTGYTPDLACSSGTLLYAYRTGSSSTGNQDVMARRLDLQGSFLGSAFPISAGLQRELEPAVCWNGTEFVAAWEDQRDVVTFYDHQTEIFLTRITEGGMVLDPSGVPASNDPGASAQPALFASGQGGSLLAVTGMRREEPLANWRVAVRTAGPWGDLGFALPGSAGDPVLDGAGELALNSTLSFGVSNARPLASGLLIGGRGRADQPFRGGVMVPRRDRAFPFTTDVQGRALVPVPVAIALPPGTTVYAQAWLRDSSGPQGAAASNALRAVAP